MKVNNQQNTKKEPKEPKCRVTSFKKGTTKKEIVPENKINRYKPRDFHLLIDLVHLQIYRRVNGKPKPISANKKGIRGRPLELLTKLARRPGIFMSPFEIGNMQPHVISHFIRDNIIQYVRKLRLNLFGENGSNPKHIVTSTSPYKVALSGDISVCLIEPDTDGMQEEEGLGAK